MCRSLVAFSLGSRFVERNEMLHAVERRPCGKTERRIDVLFYLPLHVQTIVVNADSIRGSYGGALRTDAATN